MTSDDKEFHFEIEARPPLVLQVDEGEYVVLKNQGDDLMLELDAKALYVDVDNVYALKKNQKGAYEWTNTFYEEDTNLRSIK